MTRTHSILVTGFIFSIKGIVLKYKELGQVKIVELCPKATCQLLEDLKQIEGFELDANGEPVILFTDDKSAQGYDGEVWCDFVKTFYLSNRMGEILAEHLSDTASFAYTQSIINRLLQPLKAA